jgi:hypothetical protein
MPHRSSATSLELIWDLVEDGRVCPGDSGCRQSRPNQVFAPTAIAGGSSMIAYAALKRRGLRSHNVRFGSNDRTCGNPDRVPRAPRRVKIGLLDAE